MESTRNYPKLDIFVKIDDKLYHRCRGFNMNTPEEALQQLEKVVGIECQESTKTELIGKMYYWLENDQDRVISTITASKFNKEERDKNTNVTWKTSFDENGKPQFPLLKIVGNSETPEQVLFVEKGICTPMMWEFYKRCYLNE